MCVCPGAWGMCPSLFKVTLTQFDCKQKFSTTRKKEDPLRIKTKANLQHTGIACVCVRCHSTALVQHIPRVVGNIRRAERQLVVRSYSQLSVVDQPLVAPVSFEPPSQLSRVFEPSKHLQWTEAVAESTFG